MSATGQKTARWESVSEPRDRATVAEITLDHQDEVIRMLFKRSRGRLHRDKPINGKSGVKRSHLFFAFDIGVEGFIDARAFIRGHSGLFRPISVGSAKGVILDAFDPAFDEIEKGARTEISEISGRLEALSHQLETTSRDLRAQVTAFVESAFEKWQKMERSLVVEGGRSVERPPIGVYGTVPSYKTSAFKDPAGHCLKLTHDRSALRHLA